MSLLDRFMEAIIKAEKEEAAPQTEPPTQTQTQTQTQSQSESNSELEELKALLAETQKQLNEAQTMNRNLLNTTSAVNNNLSFSEIMREQKYHPLAQRGE